MNVDNYQETDFEIFNIYPAYIKIDQSPSIPPEYIGIYSLYSFENDESEDVELKYIKN